jgi:hypothetical protein
MTQGSYSSSSVDGYDFVVIIWWNYANVKYRRRKLCESKGILTCLDEIKEVLLNFLIFYGWWWSLQCYTKVVIWLEDSCVDYRLGLLEKWIEWMKVEP